MRGIEIKEDLWENERGTTNERVEFEPADKVIKPPSKMSLLLILDGKGKD